MQAFHAKFPSSSLSLAPPPPMSLSAPPSTASLQAHTVLTLFPDDPRNTSLYLPSGALLYETMTDAASGVTRLLRTDSPASKKRPKTVAQLHAHGVVNDLVVFADRGPVLLAHWLRLHAPQTRACDEFYVLEDQLNRLYEWRGRWTQQQWVLELFALDTPGGPIARFTRSYLDFDADRRAPPEVDATLALSARAAEIQDLCVASCLFLERNQRVAMLDVHDHHYA
ncbi:hypothetical protein AURDEDRAFT_188066 [Auricularia subglabra TFB-10046 SS5]|nr:hypothetical protein AURDEDRAFT_188066 [Auricularia subglabra TFB-10046 SS5]